MPNFFARPQGSPRAVEARVGSAATCPICDSRESTYLFSKARCRLLRCAGCDFVRIERRTQQATGPHVADGPTEYGSSKSDRDGTTAPLTEQFSQQALRIAAASLPSAPATPLRVGWVGFGNDGLAPAASEAGIHLSVLDVSRLARQSPGTAEVLELRTTHVAPTTSRFDVCIVAIPLERLADPLSILQAAHRLIHDDGIVLVVCENLIPSRPRFEDWPLDRGTHNFYNHNTATGLLFRCGFGRIKTHELQGNSSRRGATKACFLTASKRYPEDPAAHRNRLSIVMAVYNEKRTFSRVFELVHAKKVADLEKEIIVVESNSTDGSREDVLLIANRPDVKVILEDRPQGKGHAVRNGLTQAIGDFVIIQDADLEYDIEDYDLLLDPLVHNRTAFVLGTRHGPDGGGLKMRHFEDQKLVGLIMNLAHLFFTQLFNTVYRQHLADPFTMFKVFRRDCIDGLTFECNRFDFDWELMAKLVRRGYTPVEIPINYISRPFSAGKKVSFFRDPLTWIKACFKYRFVKV
jgi:Glycosyl transferase family 2